MSTTTTIPSSSGLAISYSLSTRARIAYNVVGEDGKDNWIRKEVPEEEAKKVETSAEFEVKGVKYPALVEVIQTFKVPSANTLEGIQQLVPDEEEIVNLFSGGLSVKLGNKIRSRLMATDDDGNFTFEPTEQPFDMTADAAIKTNRRLTEDEKLQKSLQEVQLTPEKIQELMAVLQAKLSASGGAALGQ